jgi:molybdopterin-guanine dinucleotide biosynthesis protein A
MPADRTGDWDAIVLTGGASRRMDGAAKPTLRVDGRTLLQRVVAALEDARRVIAVGPRTVAPGIDCWAREDPPGGGPALALAAGVAVAEADLVAVVAGDLPFLTAAAMTQLRTVADPLTVSVAVDDRGHDQYLLAVWPTALLRGALAAAGPLRGRSLRSVYHGVAVRRVELDGAPPPWWDCDTPEQLARARAWADDPPARRPGRVTP